MRIIVFCLILTTVSITGLAKADLKINHKSLFRMMKLTEEQVDAILAAAADPMSDALDREVTQDELSSAYDAGTCTITYEGQNPDGTHTFKVTYDGGSILVIMAETF